MDEAALPARNVKRLADLRTLLDGRHSCRAFLPHQVPRALQEMLFAAAQRSASWCNSQSWHVSVASGAAADRLRRVLLAHATAQGEPSPDFPLPRSYRGVYLDRRRECGFQLYSALGITRQDKAGARRQSMRNFEFFDAPHVAIVTSDSELGVYGAVDCGGWVANFLLAAEACGIAAVPQAALATYSSLVKETLGLPFDRPMVCAISFGYADSTHPANAFRTRRAVIKEVVDWIDK